MYYYYYYYYLMAYACLDLQLRETIKWLGNVAIA